MMRQKSVETMSQTEYKSLCSYHNHTFRKILEKRWKSWMQNIKREELSKKEVIRSLKHLRNNREKHLRKIEIT